MDRSVLPKGDTISRVEFDQTVATLLEDARFMAAFGKTYDQFTNEEIEKNERIFHACFQPGMPMADLNGRSGAAHTLFEVARRPALLAQLTATRNKSTPVDLLTAELPTLQPGESGTTRFQAIQAASPRALATASNSQIVAYRAAEASARSRIIVAGDDQRLAAALADIPSDPSGLDKLFQLAQKLELPNKQNDPDAQRQLSEIRTRQQALGAKLAAPEYARIDAFGEGMEGLERSKKWLENNSFVNYPRIQSVADLRRYYNEKRAKIMQPLKEKLDSKIEAMKTSIEVDDFRHQYFTNIEGETPVGKEIDQHMLAKRLQLWGIEAQAQAPHKTPVGGLVDEKVARGIDPEKGPRLLGAVPYYFQSRWSELLKEDYAAIQKEDPVVLICRYNSGNRYYVTYVFWRNKAPPTAEKNRLEKRMAHHPLGRIGAARSSCPRTQDDAEDLVVPRDAQEIRALYSETSGAQRETSSDDAMLWTRNQ